jgi:hypothetical protein
MALASYQDLQDRMTEWLGNSLNASVYPDMIRLFECSAARRLKVRDTQDTATITMSSGSGSLPSDFLGMKYVQWPGSPAVDLVYAHPSYLTGLYPTDAQGIPQHYTIEASTIKVRPVDDTSLSILYVKRTAAVSGTLNWLFTNHPDAYLFGSLVEAEAFGVNDERAAFWKLRRDEVFDEILKLDFNSRGPMQIRVFGPTP